jgi:predicted N-acetyltransferase YhbS
MTDIDYRISPPLGDIILNRLFSEAWPDQEDRRFARVLERSLTYIGAFDEDVLVGFVNVAWDGGAHAFLLEPTVTPAYQHRGIGSELVRLAAQEAADAGAEWLHADFGADLETFFTRCGFRPTRGGRLSLASRRLP